MVAGRIKEAMSDLAETIRRVFQPPVSHPVPLDWTVLRSGRIPPLDVNVATPFTPCAAVPVREPMLQSRPAASPPLSWTPRVEGEGGLRSWAAGARVCALPMFQADRCARLAVPALPAWAQTRRERVEAPPAQSRSGWTGLPVPGTRSGHQPLGADRVHAGLAAVLDQPMAVTGEDLAKVSKTLWMRYTLQLVRATGENIRNLEVLGLYRIPVKGTRQVRHDPATGRLLVSLGPEALGARRAPFILARRRNDAAVVCSFVEEA